MSTPPPGSPGSPGSPGFQGSTGSLDDACARIEAWELAVAEHVAKVTLPRHTPSVWEILIPILIALRMSVHGDRRKEVAENLMRIKRMALLAARRLAWAEQRSEVLADLEAETASRLAEEDAKPREERFYDAAIRQAQLGEVAFLMDHYAALLAVRGDDFEARLRVVCPDREAFETHLDELAEHEAKVLAASSALLGERGDPRLAARMGEEADAFRRREAARIYRG